MKKTKKNQNEVLDEECEEDVEGEENPGETPPTQKQRQAELRDNKTFSGRGTEVQK